MVSEASAVPADQLERNTLAIGLLHNRFRILETRLAFLDERFSGSETSPVELSDRNTVAGPWRPVLARWARALPV